MKTNQMHYLSLIYFANQPLLVSDMFIAHHQEVFTIYVQQLVQPGQLPVNLNVKHVPIAVHIYSEYFLIMGNKHARNK
jgi:hypothetical protein